MEINVLELLSNCHNKVIGIKQVTKQIENGAISLVILADDADSHFLDNVIALCKSYDVKIINAPTRKLLGNWCRVAVPTAVVGIIK